MWNRAVRRDRRTFCAPPGRRGPLPRDADARKGEERLPRPDQSRVDGVPASLRRSLRPDRVGRYARYFGDLNGIIAALAGALRPNGLVVFTLEHAVADSPGIDYRLELHGRYSHARSYVEKLLTISGLQPEIIQADLRTEAGAPVPGLVIRATKSVSVQ